MQCARPLYNGSSDDVSAVTQYLPHEENTSCCRTLIALSLCPSSVLSGNCGGVAIGGRHEFFAKKKIHNSDADDERRQTYTWAPSCTKSSTDDSSVCCGVLQSACVNVSVAGAISPSVASSVNDTVTSLPPAGSDVSAATKHAVASDPSPTTTDEPSQGEKTSDATSLSVHVPSSEALSSPLPAVALS
jgi:hypothetical protein